MGDLLPQPGAVVRVRSRQWLVEDVADPPLPGQSHLVRLACLDDDAQGEPLEVLWEAEVDAHVLGAASWASVAKRGFDPAHLFAAYLHALRWSCVTSTNPRLFQAPYRAGIEVMAYQLEPLRKALLLPRANLFVADDVGLGKTIEAALILRELLMRQKVRRIVVACPPSVVLQWRDELEQRFGLTFVVHDRSFVARCRRDRGYNINPWSTHTRFIISHALLRDEDYATPLRDWLGDFAAGTLLILDEAHNAAPASAARYAVDSDFTKAIRDLAPRFEHRLFLSATPHNGLSNSFAALLELLDPQRFERGVPVKSPKQLDAVMVRRLKSDLREISGGFPRREVIQIDLDGLPPSAPELRLAHLLDRYWTLREARLLATHAPPSARAASSLVLTNLQKRLLSSIEAFHRTLAAHRRAVEKQAAAAVPLPEAQAEIDDDELTDDEREAADASVVEAASASPHAPSPEELALLEEMASLADDERAAPDARVQHLIAWIRSHLLLPDGKRWAERRVLLFTEYADTKRYLDECLRTAFANTERAADRIATYHGGMSDETRDELKRAFTARPANHPLRILIATDAAREGVNLQNHCADLFHIDLPWNPSRIEQRNGRIDRKLQRAEVVHCHYYVYKQRPADRVLEVLVERTKTIQEELGSLSPVLEARLANVLADGIAPNEHERLIERLRAEKARKDDRSLVDEELEQVRARKSALETQLEHLRDMLDISKKWIDLGDGDLRAVIDAALHLLGAPPLTPRESPPGSFDVPALDRRDGADPTWADTLDTLRVPRERGVPKWEWQRNAPLRPVVFADTGSLDGDVVHLHLEHRFVQRLLARLLTQGFVHDDLSRACVGHVRDAIPRVIVLGRLALYGARASRLHDEIVPIAARWVEPSARSGPVAPFADKAQSHAWDLLTDSITLSGGRAVPQEVQKKLLASVERDVAELLPALDAECERIAADAIAKLTQRGEREAREMTDILEAQRKRIQAEQRKHENPQLAFDFSEDERKQLASDRRYWQKRLDALAKELVDEPARVRATYEVRARRIEPVGVVYLWPVSG